MSIIINDHTIKSVRHTLPTGILPSNLQEIGFIQSTGSQYVDTGIVLTEKHSVLLEYTLATIENKILFGARSSSASRTFTFNIGNYDDKTKVLGAYYNGPWSTGASPDLNRHTIFRKYNGSKSQLYFDGTYITQATTTSFSTPGSALLFACRQGSSTPTLYSRMKFHRLIIWDGDMNIIANCSPCWYSDETEGSYMGVVYDYARHIILPNQGTGTFTTTTNVCEHDFVYIYKGTQKVYEKI